MVGLQPMSNRAEGCLISRPRTASTRRSRRRGDTQTDRPSRQPATRSHVHQIGCSRFRIGMLQRTGPVPMIAAYWEDPRIAELLEPFGDWNGNKIAQAAGSARAIF